MENSPRKQEGQEPFQPSILYKLYDIEYTYEEAVQKTERLASATGESVREVAVLDPQHQVYMMTDVYTGLLTKLPTGDVEAHKKATRSVLRGYAGQVIDDLVYPSGERHKLADQYHQCHTFAKALAGHLADGDDLQELQFTDRESALLTAAATRVHHLWKPYVPNNPIELSLANDPIYPKGYPNSGKKYSAALYDQSLRKASWFYARIAKAAPLPGEPVTHDPQGRATITNEHAIELTTQRLTNYLFNGVLGAVIDPIVHKSLTEEAERQFADTDIDRYIHKYELTFRSVQAEYEFRADYRRWAEHDTPSVTLLRRFRHPPVRVTIGETAAGKSTVSLQEPSSGDSWIILHLNRPFNMKSDEITVMARDNFRPSVFVVPEDIPPDTLPEALLRDDRTNYIERTNEESAWKQERAEDLASLLYTFDTCPLLCLEFVPPQEGSGYRIGALEKFANAQVIQVEVPIPVSVLRAEQRARVDISENVPYAQVDSNRIFPLSEILKTHRNAGFYVEAFNRPLSYVIRKPYDPSVTGPQPQRAYGYADVAPEKRPNSQYLIVCNDVPKGHLMTPILRYDFEHFHATIYDLPSLLSLGLKKFLRKDLTDDDRQAVLENRPEIYEGGSNDPVRSVEDILQMLRKIQASAADNKDFHRTFDDGPPTIDFDNGGRIYASISCSPGRSNIVTLEYNPHDELTYSDEFRAVRRLLETTYTNDELTISYLLNSPDWRRFAGLTMYDAEYVARYVDAREKYHYSPEVHSAAVKAKRRRRRLGKIALATPEMSDVRPSTDTT